VLDQVGRDLVRAPRALDRSPLPKPFPRISPKLITSHYPIHHLEKLACAPRRSAPPWWPPTEIPANGSGILRVATPRNAFFNSYTKFAIRTGVIPCLEGWLRDSWTLRVIPTSWIFREGFGCLKVLFGCVISFVETTQRLFISRRALRTTDMCYAIADSPFLMERKIY